MRKSTFSFKLHFSLSWVPKSCSPAETWLLQLCASTSNPHPISSKCEHIFPTGTYGNTLIQYACEYTQNFFWRSFHTEIFSSQGNRKHWPIHPVPHSDRSGWVPKTEKYMVLLMHMYESFNNWSEIMSLSRSVLWILSCPIVSHISVNLQILQSLWKLIWICWSLQ